MSSEDKAAELARQIATLQHTGIERGLELRVEKIHEMIRKHLSASDVSGEREAFEPAQDRQARAQCICGYQSSGPEDFERHVARCDKGER